MTPENFAVFELLPDAELMVVDMRVRLKLPKRIRKHQDQQRRKTLKEQGRGKPSDNKPY